MAYFRCGGGVPSSVKTLPTYKTASGSVATFETDMTENLISCVCEIVAQQASGTPSPDNPLPITTYTEMNVLHCGVNLFDESTYNTNHRYIDIRNLKIGATYNILAKNSSGLALFKIATASGSTPVWQSTNVSGATFTITQAMIDIGKLFIINSSYQQATVEEVQTAKISLNYPSTDTEYHAYNGTTANIPFGQTVANGVLDITTGKLRVTHGVADMGTLPWELAATQTGHWWFRANVPNVAKAGGNSVIPDIKCEVYQTITPNNAYTGNMGITSNASADNYLHATDENYSDATSFIDAVNGKKVVYKLVTPIEIQLDSITLQALLNENNIWCDTNGNTTAKYILSVGEALRQA